MTHLVIELPTTGIEQVSSSVIEKLYNLAVSGDLDASSNLLGRLSVNATYLEYIDELEELFDELYITATKIYIKFADPEVKRVLLANNIGDGVGVSTVDAAATAISNIFASNTTILSFDEFDKFTASQAGNFSFNGCTSLTSIDLSNVTSIGESAFNGCTSLTTVTWPSSNYTLNNAAFKNSGLTGDIDLSNCTTANIFETYKNVFAGSKITSIYNCVNAVKFGEYDNDNVGQFSNCTELVKADFSLALFTNVYGNKAFIGCKKLKYVKFPNTLTTIGSIFGWTLYNNTIKIYLPCTTIPTFRNTNAKLNETYNAPQYTCNIEVYVPDAKVTDYQSSDWGSYTILPISQYSES